MGKDVVAEDEVLSQPGHKRKRPRGNTLPVIDSVESTRTLDLTSLFSEDVTSSGSYYTNGVRITLFGRLVLSVKRRTGKTPLVTILDV
jgi:hypothetical protein